MKALILAGGLGTRLRPVVANAPKGLAPLLGKPFLEYQILWLREQGISDIVFCVGYRAGDIAEYFGDGGAWGLNIAYSQETAPLGTGGALRLAREHISDTFLAMNGDTYYLDSLAELLETHQRSGAKLTLGVSPSGPNTASGQLLVDDQGRVIRFWEKEEATVGGWLNAGIYVMEPDVLDFIPAGRAVSLEREVFPDLIAAAPVYACPMPGGYLDMGTPEGYARLAEHLAASAKSRK